MLLAPDVCWRNNPISLMKGQRRTLRVIAHTFGAVSALILSADFACSLAGGYWGILHPGSQTGFFAWMVLALLFALIATLKGSRRWLMAVAIVLAYMYLFHPVVFACPISCWR
jgi:hypothetical protein